MTLEQLSTSLQELLRNTEGEHGVAIHDLGNGQTFRWQADMPFVAASVIKVPIMAAVFARWAEGAFKLSDRITIRGEDMVTGSGFLQHLTPGLRLPIQDLLMLMIIDSDNTATNLLIDLVGTSYIQQKMAEWGLSGSRFYNKLQVIPAHREGVNTITAEDMMQLMANMAQGRIVSWDACRRMIDILKRQRYNDGLPSLLPATAGPIGSIPLWEMAHKTGFVDDLDHDVGLLYTVGRTFAIAVLSRGTDSVTAKRLKGQIGRLLFHAAQNSGV
ncbi:MAG: class A beta-lactamase-related serine hydrolase [Alicyclobacillus sp.]|nr:class A beta-lactamase-related serine hydrolase [Alicyclobacillus sp.]